MGPSTRAADLFHLFPKPAWSGHNPFSWYNDKNGLENIFDLALASLVEKKPTRGLCLGQTCSWTARTKPGLGLAWFFWGALVVWPASLGKTFFSLAGVGFFVRPFLARGGQKLNRAII
jgi:hypothetical protein